MSSSLILNAPTAAMQMPLEFLTPLASTSLLLRRRRERAANEPPALNKRKRTSPLSSASDGAATTSFLPINTSLPFLDCANFCDDPLEGQQHQHQDSRVTPRLPNITLLPRTKKSRRPYFMSSSAQDQEQYIYKPLPRRRRIIATPSAEDDDDKNTAVDVAVAVAPSTIFTVAKDDSLQRRASKSSSNISTTRRPSLSMTRSLSLQFNLSLLNLASAATGSVSSSCSSAASMPKRNSLIHVPYTSSSQDDQKKDQNNRRSPVTTTFDYLATVMRFPDVAIGLSI